MIDNLVLTYLKYAHGLYNILVILLFLYQSSLGLKLRKERVAGNLPAVKVIKWHRKLGRLLTFMGIAGFLSGVFLIYFHVGKFFVYRLHFMTGLFISFLIIITFFISNKIKGRESLWRNLHFATGIIIISLYFFQAFLGIGILF